MFKQNGSMLKHEGQRCQWSLLLTLWRRRKTTDVLRSCQNLHHTASSWLDARQFPPKCGGWKLSSGLQPPGVWGHSSTSWTARC